MAWRSERKTASTPRTASARETLASAAGREQRLDLVNAKDVVRGARDAILDRRLKAEQVEIAGHHLAGGGLEVRAGGAGQTDRHLPDGVGTGPDRAGRFPAAAASAAPAPTGARSAGPAGGPPRPRRGRPGTSPSRRSDAAAKPATIRIIARIFFMAGGPLLVCEADSAS